MRVATLAATALAVLGTVRAEYVHDKRMKKHSAGGSFAPKEGICFSACYLPLNFVQWGDMKPGSFWGMKVSSEAWLSSVVACMDTYCSLRQADEGWARLQTYLELSDMDTRLPPYEAVLDTIDYGRIQIVDCLDSESQKQVYNSTILSVHDNFENGWRTDYAMEQQMALHNLFGLSIFALVAQVVMIGAAYRLWVYFSNKRTRAAEGGYISLKSTSDSDGGSDAYTWYKKHIGTPSVGGYRHLQPAWWGFISLPSRVEACIIFAYVSINIAFTVIKYDLFYDNMYWYGQIDVQFARYLADRTGIMCFYNMALLWAFAGRNDVLIWITGWSFQSMNLFHRWAARVATVQAIIHSIGYTYLVWGNVWVFMQRKYWIVGVIATIVMSLLLPLSMRPLRVKMYEAFLLIHIGCSIALLVLLYYHVETFGYTMWIWICGGIWAFDRLLRVVRVLLLNTKVISAPNATAQITDANGLIRLSVDTSLTLAPRPGDYYFLYSPLSLTPCENHPFTLASAETLPKGGVRLHFLIMPLSGWTGRLRKSIEAGNTDMRILLEGPYGHAANVSSCDHVLLVAGGSGIAAILPYLATLPGRKVTLVWMTRNAEYAVDVFSNELSASAISDVPIELFVTRQDASTALSVLKTSCRSTFSEAATPSGASIDSNADDESRTAPGVHIASGRPEMDRLVRSALDRLVGDENLGVVACGPGVMLDDLRKVIANSYGSEKGQVSGSTLHYFEEAFVW